MSFPMCVNQTAYGVELIGSSGAMIGAVCGAVMAAMNGGDINQGFLNGALSGAISGAMFYCAGSVISTANVSEPCLGTVYNTMSAASKAGIHAAAGAASGAINAAITGGDVGKEALIGALSAGVSKYTGVDNFAGRTAIGAGTGGLSSLMHGGDFAEGAIQGARSSAIAYVCNDLMHLVYDKSEGILYKIENYFESDTPSVEKYDAVSGPYGNGALENGWYELTGEETPVPSESNSMTDTKNNTYKFRLHPLFRTSRSGLLIHPDGGVSGTAGCIGLTGDTTSFRSAINSYLNSPNGRGNPSVDMTIRVYVRD